MIEIKPRLTKELENFVGAQTGATGDAYQVSTYRRLVEHVARLAYVNRDHLLFFRGQAHDYRSKGQASTFYPGIYRGESLSPREVGLRFGLLEDAVNQLKRLFRDSGLEGVRDVNRRQYIQWSILQHYEVCATPLLDFTHSVRVAASFAQMSKGSGDAFVFVFGLPYVTNRISINSEQEIVNVRLLSICPPDAIRPYFQDGYLAGTEDVTDQYESKTELDFRQRLVAKFAIPTGEKFWGQGFSRLPRAVLYPRNDRIEKLCARIQPVARTAEGEEADVGRFLAAWVEVERAITGVARSRFGKVQSIRRAIEVLRKEQVIDSQLADDLNRSRLFRNELVHRPFMIDQRELSTETRQVENLRIRLPW
jgi:uncharacterized protein YutE (UPF0331/DUF86 family)